ncbi:calpain-11-like isoform X2 [Artemia franciscana]|uniref:calpain-11-like isoform X2 n=1 Tax=Artemia franciscana TaxID=6661 RepID=UPI0032D9ED45
MHYFKKKFFHVKEITYKPKFISDGSTRFDVEQGEFGDPWLLAAVSYLTLTPRFLDRVVPPDQNFDYDYCGAFRFFFWRFGEWIEVVVDDKLPTMNGKLIFLHSRDLGEFWAALLEKAYAKLYGSYEALQAGFTTKALEDLTGGIVQSFSLAQQDIFLTHQVLNSAVPRSTLLVASIQLGRKNKRKLKLQNGLITQHTYSVTGLARIQTKFGETSLIRLKNPWGRGEWNGAWSERSEEWNLLSSRDKELLSIRVRNEGEFWMSFNDFTRHFTHLDLVHVGPDDWMNEPALHTKRPWRAVLARRRWRTGYNAGGGPQYKSTTAMNPQFHLHIPRGHVSKCHVVVSVMQEYSTVPTKKKNRTVLHPIGFALYEIPPTISRLTPVFINEHKPLDVTNHCIAREVVTFFTLPPGDYIIVPQTAHPNCDAKFLLRIFTDEQSIIWEVNDDNIVFWNTNEGYIEDACRHSTCRQIVSKYQPRYPTDVDALALKKILKGHWRDYLPGRPSFEICKNLIMLRDYTISGRLTILDVPGVLHLLELWKSAFLKFDRKRCGKTSSFNLRQILWESGATVSNKVLECLVLRFSKEAIISAETFIMAVVRLYLAHERYMNINGKTKGNILSLEEMILMTIYS